MGKTCSIEIEFTTFYLNIYNYIIGYGFDSLEPANIFFSFSSLESTNCVSVNSRGNTWPCAVVLGDPNPSW